MVNHPRGSRSRHRSGRSLIRDRDRATPVNVPKGPLDKVIVCLVSLFMEIVSIFLTMNCFWNCVGTKYIQYNLKREEMYRVSFSYYFGLDFNKPKSKNSIEYSTVDTVSFSQYNLVVNT